MEPSLTFPPAGGCLTNVIGILEHSSSLMQKSQFTVRQKLQNKKQADVTMSVSDCLLIQTSQSVIKTMQYSLFITAEILQTYLQYCVAKCKKAFRLIWTSLGSDLLTFLLRRPLSSQLH